MEVQIKKWGNSASVRLPASVMAAASLRVDQSVEVRVEDGRVVLEPVTSKRMTFEERVAALDPATFHDVVDWGPPVGKEVW
jgi:antitoxin MazE